MDAKPEEVLKEIVESQGQFVAVSKTGCHTVLDNVQSIAWDCDRNCYNVRFHNPFNDCVLGFSSEIGSDVSLIIGCLARYERYVREQTSKVAIGG